MIRHGSLLLSPTKQKLPPQRVVSHRLGRRADHLTMRDLARSFCHWRVYHCSSSVGFWSVGVLLLFGKGTQHMYISVPHTASTSPHSLCCDTVLFSLSS